MIKINLSTAKKQVDISNIGGFDFTKLKIKAVLLVIVLIYLPDFLVIPMWEEERNTINQQVTETQMKLAGLKQKVAQFQELERQIRELKAQEENLEKKLTAVKEAISEKKNPAPILLYLSKNIPAELWIKELLIDGDSMTIKGEAMDYTSIGNFVNSLRSSIFVKDANITSTASVVRESDKRRIETFEVKFGILRFDQ
jgi:type IV pilus assembly protein PilN